MPLRGDSSVQSSIRNSLMGSSSKIYPSDRATPNSFVGLTNNQIIIDNQIAKNLPSKQRLPSSSIVNETIRNAPNTDKTRPQKTFTSWLLDAIYFICPDCSCVQCSSIAGGFLLMILLTLLFLHLAGYFSRPSSQINNRRIKYDGDNNNDHDH